MTILEALAARTAAIFFDQLNDHGVDLVRTALVDTLGVAIAGSDFEGSAIVRATSVGPAGTGPSLVLGTSERLSAIDAGLLNGMAAHALDYDDGNIVLIGHPSTVLVPAILALGEELDASLEDITVAYAAGFEVIIRVARGVNTPHYEKGWHPTSTIGVLGVAAAAARLLGLDTSETTVALAIACSMASGIKANFGTMVKALHVGHAVRNGLLAAKLAAGGMTANPSAMEAVQGWLNVYNGSGTFEADAIIAGHRDLEVNCGLNPIKVYPCCASTHSGVRATLDLRAAYDIRPENVAKVRVVVDAKRLPHTDRPVIAEALSGKFSAQFVVARALINGKVGLADFEGHAHLDPATLALMAKVEVVAAPAGGPENSFAADVTITTTSAGEQLRTVVDPGADPSLMAGEQQLWEKFEDCAGQVMAPVAVRALMTALHSFPFGGSVRGLMALAEPTLPLAGVGRAS